MYPPNERGNIPSTMVTYINAKANEKNKHQVGLNMKEQRRVSERVDEGKRANVKDNERRNTWRFRRGEIRSRYGKEDEAEGKKIKQGYRQK